MALDVNLLLQLQIDNSLSSSKGNQNKWFYENKWYKEDSLGYESLSEILISKLLAKTNVGQYVDYQYETIMRNNVSTHGCVSTTFMTDADDQVISVERLFQQYRGISATKAILIYETIEDKIQYVVNAIEEITGLQDFGTYIRKILTIDALFLNEDRHFHNIAVIRKKDGSFRECPIFDQGAALFSDIRMNYPLDKSLDDCYTRIKAKPFSMDFDEQLEACEMLYHNYHFQAYFTIHDVEKILNDFHDIYNHRILERAENIMKLQVRKYAYLFSK